MSEEDHSHHQVIKHELDNYSIIRVLAWTILAAGLVYLVISLLPILALVLVSVLLAIAIDPAIRALERYRIPRYLAIVLFMTALLGITSLGAVLIAPPLFEQVQKMAAALPGYLNNLENNSFYHHLDHEYGLIEPIKDGASSLPGVIANGIGDIVGSVIITTVATFSVFFLTILLLISGKDITHLVIKTWPQLATGRAWSVIVASYQSIGAYVAGNIILSLLAGVSLAAVLYVMDLPFILALALWMAIFDIVPLVGATIGAAPAIAVAFGYGGIWEGIIVSLFIFIYQQIENGFLQPHILGKLIALSPLFVFLAVLCGAQLMGVVGALIAIPVAGVLQIFLQEYLREYLDHDIEIPSLKK